MEAAAPCPCPCVRLCMCDVCATKLFGVLIAMRLVDRIGRRPLLIAGALLTAASLLGTAAALQAEPPSPMLLLLSLMSFVLFYALSLAPIFFVLLAELFSTSAKPVAAGALTALTFLGGAITDTTFDSLLLVCGDWGTFGMLAAVCVLGGVIVLIALPETKGRSLWEVQTLLGGGRGLSRAIVSFRDGSVVVEACRPAGSARFSLAPNALGSQASQASGFGGSSFAASSGAGGSFFGGAGGSGIAAAGTERALLQDAEAYANEAEAEAEVNTLLRKQSSAVVLAA